jgi:hypothetical protein
MNTSHIDHDCTDANDVVAAGGPELDADLSAEPSNFPRGVHDSELDLLARRASRTQCFRSDRIYCTPVIGMHQLLQ